MRFFLPSCLAAAMVLWGLALTPLLVADEKDEKKADLPVKRVVMFSSGCFL